MNMWRWFGALAILVGFLVVAGAKLPVVAAQDKDQKDAKKGDDKKPADKKTDDTKPDDKKGADKKGEEPKVTGDRLEWKAFDPKAKPFYQKLITKTEQKMKVMTQEINQKQDQTFYILWTPKEKSKEGYWVVTQEIVGVEMKIDIGGNVIQFKSTDPKQAPNPMTDFFNALLKLKLTLSIDPATMSVKKVEGREEFVKKLAETNPQMKTLLDSILSEEALKAMAEPTWGAFPVGDYKKPWTRPSSLDLGPIGKYETKFDYTYEGPDAKEKADKIGVKAELNYKAPDVKGGLPFTILQANLKSKEGSGNSYFDKARGRFVKTDMKMVLEGTLKIEVGGMVTDVTLNQTQEATVETADEAFPELAAPPAKK